MQPTLPPVEVLGLPLGLLPHASLAAQLSDDPTWRRLAAQALSVTDGYCEATGAQGAVAAERWVFDEAACVLRLAGLRPLHPEVLQLEQAMLAGATKAAQQAAAEQLAGFNFWQEADAMAYVASTAAQQAARGGRDWRLDLRLLHREGVALPAGLKALAI